MAAITRAMKTRRDLMRVALAKPVPRSRRLLEVAVHVHDQVDLAGGLIATNAEVAVAAESRDHVVRPGLAGAVIDGGDDRKERPGREETQVARDGRLNHGDVDRDRPDLLRDPAVASENEVARLTRFQSRAAEGTRRAARVDYAAGRQGV